MVIHREDTLSSFIERAILEGVNRTKEELVKRYSFGKEIFSRCNATVLLMEVSKHG